MEVIIPERDSLTVHDLVEMHRTLLRHLQNVNSHSVLVQKKLDEIGNLILQTALQSGSDPLDEQGLEKFSQKLIDLEASQKLMFEAGKRMFTRILDFRDFLDSSQPETASRNSGDS